MTAAAPSLSQWYAATRWHSYQHHRVVYQYEKTDRSIPTLLIHGFPTASWDWHRIWPDLRPLGPLVAPDLLGFGYSSKPVGYPYSIQDQAQLCLSLCRELKIDRIHILAHDYGDSVAQELLALSSAGLAIESVYLLNGGIIPGEHRPRPIQKLLVGPLGSVIARFMSRARFRRSFAAVFGPDNQPSDADLQACWRLIEQHGGRRVMATISQYQKERTVQKRRWVDALTNAPCPTGAYIGDLDPVSGAHMAEALSRRCPELRITRNSSIAHYPQLEA
ncbi:MAG: alpha/beta fold hydrolase, partial [Lysobacterales bacterium]